MQVRVGSTGRVAHLGERLVCTEKVAGSSPVTSTSSSRSEVDRHLAKVDVPSSILGYCTKGVLMNRDDCIYLAGLFDGEGTVGCYSANDRRRPRIHLSIGMTDEEVVRWCHTITGLGGVAIRTQTNPAWNTLYRWQVNDRKAIQVLALIMPWLKTKKQQATNALVMFNGSI